MYYKGVGASVTLDSVESGIVCVAVEFRGETNSVLADALVTGFSGLCMQMNITTPPIISEAAREETI